MNFIIDLAKRQSAKILIIIFLVSHIFANAQNQKDSLCIHFNFKWKNEQLELNRFYHSKSDLLRLTTIKFYISGIAVKYKDNSIFIQKNSYHLVDIEDRKSSKINICKTNNKSISKVMFSIGVDSLASVSGALSGDLDATKAMYWAWQSGFINMKIEGKSNSCNTRKNEFQFHIGGYSKPNYALRKIELLVNKSNANEVAVDVDLSKLFENIELRNTNSIMIPGIAAMNIADFTAKMFYIP